MYPMYCALVSFSSPAFDEILSLRDLVLRQPLNMEFSLSEIRREWKDLHYGFYNNSDKLLGTCSYVNKNNHEYKMRQVCVHPRYQGRGIGQKMVAITEDELVRRFEAQKVFLHAREQSLPFYLRMNYIRAGEKFMELGIPHYLLQKKLNND